MLSIYTLPRVPGATETREWVTFCHSRDPFVVIGYETLRSTSRWNAVERKKKFCVSLYRRNRHGTLYHYDERYYTLERAQREAARIAKQEHGR